VRESLQAEALIEASEHSAARFAAFADEEVIDSRQKTALLAVCMPSATAWISPGRTSESKKTAPDGADCRCEALRKQEWQASQRLICVLGHRSCGWTFSVENTAVARQTFCVRILI
jgi:hypothetical protein